MNDKSLNYEEIEKDLMSFDFSAYEEGGTSLKTISGARTDIGSAIKKVCEIYAKVRPILLGILKIPFVPKIIKTAVKALCTALDLLCSTFKN
ncbi:MAG: hypothetical protein OEW75_19180 [Cyclobacteriaceae bacterium]|nr:hypothetical protein [Cyclobacteriaceae bacterium]